MRFVDGDEADWRSRSSPRRRVARLAHQPLGREIQQPVAALGEPGPHRRLVAGTHRAVVAGGGHAVADERVHLILHQRDQGRHDDRQPVAHQRRHLEAQRFAAAGGQHEQRVAAGDDRFDGVALQGTKRGVAPVLVERVEKRVGGHGRRNIDLTCRRLSARTDVTGRRPTIETMLVETPSGLYCPDGDFYIDPWGEVPRALITHAHGDHARSAARPICAPIRARRCSAAASVPTRRSKRSPMVEARHWARRA